ncbi:MAG TPA: Gfo/Idh/MocA family oxidoreductase, partial [Bacteroidales bacterium]|nr:Gfo/Idh/MocA family oxidoreductase [Bacteroidales bacterium]
MSGRVFHAPLIEAHPDFKLKAVLERTKNEAEKIYPDIITYRNYEDLLNDDEIDLIIVNLPDHLHFSFCMQALEAGKHIVVEKPFTL